MQKNGKIFLSHHSSKTELAAHLSRYLEKNGLDTWYAPRDIRSGEQWDEAISESIKSCRAVVLLFCAQADSSRQVKRELSLADRYKKPVFWIRIERVEPNNLSYFLTSTQWFDWLDERDETLEQLVKDILLLDDSSQISSLEDTPDSAKQGVEKSLFNHCWAKGVFAFNSDRDAAECAARVYFLYAQKNPESSIILPTGRSATMIFRAMVRLAGEYDSCPFGEAHIISDTETFGVWGEHETSRTKHINDTLIYPLMRLNKGPKDEQLHLLSGVFMDNDPVKTAQKTIRLYPPGVHAVSVSPIGEVLAYEVGTYHDIDEILDDAPRIVEVGEHSKKYIDPNQPSKSIITIGLGTSMAAEILLILAFDIQKANILKRLFNGVITAGLPATILRMHPNAFILTTHKTACAAGIGDFVSAITDTKDAAERIVTHTV